MNLQERPAKEESWQEKFSKESAEQIKSRANALLTDPQWKSIIDRLRASKDPRSLAAISELERARQSGASDALGNFYTQAQPAQEQAPSELEQTFRAMDRMQPGSGSRLRMQWAAKQAGEVSDRQWLLDYERSLRDAITIGESEPRGAHLP